MPGVGHVTGGVDAGGAGLQPVVDDHAVVDRQAGHLGQLRARRDPDPDDHQVAGDDPAVGGDHLFDPALAAQCHDACPEHELDPVLGVRIMVDAADLGAEHALERHRSRAHDDDLPAQLAQ